MTTARRFLITTGLRLMLSPGEKFNMVDTLSARSTVLIADDHLLIREGVKQLLRGIIGEFHAVEVADGDSLAKALASGQIFQFALVDLRMPAMEGGVRLLDLARQHPRVPIVIVSALSSFDLIRRVFQVPNVFAVVAKSASAAELRAGIESALQARKQTELPNLRSAQGPLVHLTPRQIQVRSLLRQGMTNKLIASALGISEGTVKNHITEIFRALNASNRTQAAQLELDAL